MSEQMGTDLRERAVLPVLIPVAAIVVTEIVVFSLSRVLLAAGVTPAVGIALAVALAILAGSAFVAARPRMRTQSIVGFLVVALLGVVVAGGVAAQRGAFYEGEEGAEAPAAKISATNLAFDTDTLSLEAGEAVIHFTNADSAAHNIAIFPDADSLDTELFRGEIIQGGEEIHYDEVSLEPGTYYFHCDVHPTMSGTVEVG